MAITSQPQKAGHPLTLELTKTKIEKKSWDKVKQIRTLSIERMGRRLGIIPQEEMDQVIEGLNVIIS